MRQRQRAIALRWQPKAIWLRPQQWAEKVLPILAEQSRTGFTTPFATYLLHCMVFLAKKGVLRKQNAFFSISVVCELAG